MERRPDESAARGATPGDVAERSADDVTVVDSPQSSRPQRAKGERSSGDEPLTHVGRYVILRKLGEGAMGEVYVAYDENLDRRVAIKLVRTMGQRAGDVYTRMLREAQGLARLSHPNVVQVYEAAVFQGRVYLAMEYIEGETLRDWAAREQRPWRAVLDCMIEAGKGLAAAHRVGLVHRDFKPDNVIVGVDGRVRVLDFGLVRAESEAAASDEILTASGALSKSLTATGGSMSSELTQAHTLIGTPAYMSPEQHLRETADARSDAFSFSIVLYELLYGVRPFAGKEQAEIMRSVLKQRISEPLEGRRAPAWLRRALLRGLSVDPRARFQTMDAYLAALESDPVRRLRRWWIGGVLVALIVASAAALLYAARAEAEACSGGAEAMDQVWDRLRQEEVAAAFDATGVAYSGEVTARVTRRLDGYREAWIEHHQQACLAHRRGELSSERLDLQMACLRARRRELDAVVRTFVSADAEVVESAVSAVSEPTDRVNLRACEAIDELERGMLIPASPEEALRLEATRGAVADAWALGRAGKSGAGLAALARLAKTVEDHDDPALFVEVDLTRGSLLLGDGAYDAAKKALTRAYYEARAIGHTAVAAEATVQMLRYVTTTQASAEEAEVWIRQAEAEVRYYGDELLIADFHGARARLYIAQGAFEAALADNDRALEIYRRELDPDNYKIAEALRGKGAALFKRGRNAEAREVLHEALEINASGVGPQHPSNALMWTNLALVAAREGHFADGIEDAKRALAISEGARGQLHPDNADILSNLGEIELQRGDYRASIDYLERAVAIAERAYGDESPKLMLYIASLAVARYKLGDVEAAQELMERAYLISAASLGEGHPTTGVLRSNLGEVLNDRGLYAEAKGHIEPGLAVMRQSLGSERSELGPVQRELARALFGLGQRAQAELEVRQALALSTRGKNIPGDELAKTRFVLARVLLADPDGGDEALEEVRNLVEVARHELTGYEANAGLKGELQAIEAMLSARAPQRARPKR